MNIVKIDNLSKNFKKITALDNISLEIKEGDIYGLLGPNGAGKSTMINIISGLLDFNKGNIEILRKDIKSNMREIKKNIGVVPQDIALYNELTAYENIKFFTSLYGFKGGELKNRVDKALEFVGLKDRSKGHPSEFSGGMKRRLNIACAISHTPKLIIMDEPTVGIDPQSRNHILQSVKKLNDMGSTIIYTSHYMEEVEEICTNIGIIDHGKLVAEGTKEELKAIVRDKNTVYITVGGITNIDEKEIKNINGVTDVQVKDNLIKIDSYKEINNLDKIILFFTNKNIPIKNVETKNPDLETVFLSLTGRKLRD